MYVCLCEGITHRDIEAARRRGARTPDDLGAMCGAGTGCGGCREMLAELLAAGDEACNSDDSAPGEAATRAARAQR
jgi:bacterioferritin-associated ferredoxin